MKWRKDCDAAALAQLAETAKSSGDQEGFLSSGLRVTEFELLISGYLEWNSETPDHEKTRIVSKAISDAETNRPFTADSLRHACAQREAEYLSIKPTPMRLISAISVGPNLSVPSIRQGASTIWIGTKSHVGMIAIQKHGNLVSDANKSLKFDLPRGYSSLTVLVHARTPHDAVERSLKAIDIVRAGWNLALNSRKIWRESSGRPTPINDVRLFPIYTAHGPKGLPLTSTWWYEPGYSAPARLLTDANQLEHLLKYQKKVRYLIARSPYNGDVTDALVRYVRALDSADLNDAFLKLWSLLEHLTNSTHDPYKVAMRRAAFLHADNARALLALNQLTHYRNRFVHAGIDTSEVEAYIFLLKRFVDPLLRFHLVNPFNFQTRAEAAEFMDLPVSEIILKQRIKRLKHALTYLTRR